MTKAIIACETLYDELNLAMHATGCHYPVTWVESDYHLDPALLRTRLQEEINNLKNINSILFAYGCCGNGLVGIKASTAKLVIPKKEDCVSVLLSQPGRKFERPKQTYFLTRGWIQGSKNLFSELEHALKRYGAARTKRLFKSMLKHYRYFMLVDTGAYNVDEYSSKVQELADITGLEILVVKGDTWLLKKLLTGPYDDDFCIIPPGGTVSPGHFGLMDSVSNPQAI